ncbi:thiolase domain-containing protein [Candidatus Daviesbacteria bacterium]|nr:thiolase domain-containing protein [Candidatus Daviesbacteria bacterium]
MRIHVAGTGLTKFGELWDKSLFDLSFEAATEAIKETGLKNEQIEAVFVGNMLYGKLSNQDHLGAAVASQLGIHGASFRIEGACASGGLAVHLAIQSLLAGTYKNVLVVGVEKMTDVSSNQVSSALMGASSEMERKAGLTFPALYALMAKAHMQKYGTTKKHMAAVAVKNHFHGSLNHKAHFPYEITEEKVLESSCISTPFTLFDASPVSDGAGAVVLSADNPSGRSPSGHLPGVYITGSAVATDTLDLVARKSFTELEATQQACQKALKQAGVNIKDIKVAEVHDCFTIAEIMAMEDLGFCPKGEGADFITKGHTKLGGKLPVNTSGGLKACGHPVGATGVKQIIEITHQLQGRLGKRQVYKANVGLTQNVGGTGATVVVHVLQN